MDTDVSNVIKQCNHLKWKKQIIRVQLAQESFMERLQKERENNKQQPQVFSPKNDPSDNRRLPFGGSKQEESNTNYDPLALAKSRVSVSESTAKRKSEQPASRRRYYSSSDDEVFNVM